MYQKSWRLNLPLLFISCSFNHGYWILTHKLFLFLQRFHCLNFREVWFESEDNQRIWLNWRVKLKSFMKYRRNWKYIFHTYLFYELIKRYYITHLLRVQFFAKSKRHVLWNNWEAKRKFVFYCQIFVSIIHANFKWSINWNCKWSLYFFHICP